MEDTNHKWVIVSAQWALSDFTPYDFRFDYAGYLPNGPEGTCHIFSTLPEAVEMSHSAEELNLAPRGLLTGYYQTLFISTKCTQKFNSILSLACVLRS